MRILDLFNEYNLSPEMTGGEMEQPRTEKDWNTMSRIYKAYIVSKDFGWIKWLVDNDKIDFEKVMEQNKNGYDITRVNPYDNFIDNAIEYDDELDLFIIMLLAISDTPIKDLISYLK